MKAFKNIRGVQPMTAPTGKIFTLKIRYPNPYTSYGIINDTTVVLECQSLDIMFWLADTLKIERVNRTMWYIPKEVYTLLLIRWS